MARLVAFICLLAICLLDEASTKCHDLIAATEQFCNISQYVPNACAHSNHGKLTKIDKKPVPEKRFPIIDLGQLSMENTQSLQAIAKEIGAASEEFGCFYLKNHGIDDQLIQNTMRDYKQFFHQPTQCKRQYLQTDAMGFGYVAFESENVNAAMDRRGYPNDPLEKFRFIPNDAPNNGLPSLPSSLRQHAETYYEQVTKLMKNLFILYAIAAGAPHDQYFYEQAKKAQHTFMATFYRKDVERKLNQTNRFAIHVDDTPFTIIAMDNLTNALKVQLKNGEWVYANPIPGTVFILLGHFMSVWTNDKWQGLPHQVTWSELAANDDRLSLVLFPALNIDTLITPLDWFLDGEKPKYQPLSGYEYTKSIRDKVQLRI